MMTVPLPSLTTPRLPAHLFTLPSFCRSGFLHGCRGRGDRMLNNLRVVTYGAGVDVDVAGTRVDHAIIEDGRRPLDEFGDVYARLDQETLHCREQTALDDFQVF